MLAIPSAVHCESKYTNKNHYGLNRANSIESIGSILIRAIIVE